MGPGKKLSIIIPVYNERLTIERVLEAACQAPLPEGVERELIVVDDGSVDETAELVSRFQPSCRLEFVSLSQNRGKGAAILAGIPHASGDWILIQDGDLEYDPTAYATLVLPLLKGQARVVYGSRFTGTIEKMRWPYRLANQLLTGWTNLLYRTNITDEATAYKAFERELLSGLKLNCKRFEFCPEVTGKLARRGIHIFEVPVRYLGRSRAQGKKIRWYDALIAFWVLLRERLRPR